MVVGGWATVDRVRQIAVTSKVWMQSGLARHRMGTDRKSALRPLYPNVSQATC